MSVFMEKNGVWEGNGHLAGGQFYTYRPERLLSFTPFVRIPNVRRLACALPQVNTMHSQTNIEVRPGITIFDNFTT
jgi:hypothetical protein